MEKSASIPSKKSYLISVGSILFTALFCFLANAFIGYKTVALILLVHVSLLALIFDIAPVLIASVLSAIIWNFFFIPPIYTFHIDNTEDFLMFLMYFFIALVHAVLTAKIRRNEAAIRDKEEKEKSLKLYSTLLNSLSHELRTPIATILGSSDALRENKAIISPENQDELLNQISIASLRLDRHVENLLNMSRLDSGILRLNFDWCDANDLVQYVLNHVNEHRTHIIQFTPNDSVPLFWLDRGLIEQVILNLVSNAIAHTPEGTQIQVNVSNENDDCQILVSDNGPGLNEGELPRLFEAFYRGGSAQVGGLGIGLSIVKGYVDAHAGSVRVARNTGGGLTFSVRFPANQSFVNNLKNE